MDSAIVASSLALLTLLISSRIRWYCFAEGGEWEVLEMMPLWHCPRWSVKWNFLSNLNLGPFCPVISTLRFIFNWIYIVNVLLFCLFLLIFLYRLIDSIRWKHSYGTRWVFFSEFIICPLVYLPLFCVNFLFILMFLFSNSWMATYAEYVYLIFLSLPSYESLLLNFTFLFADFIFLDCSCWISKAAESWKRIRGYKARGGS